MCFGFLFTACGSSNDEHGNGDGYTSTQEISGEVAETDIISSENETNEIHSEH